MSFYPYRFIYRGIYGGIFGRRLKTACRSGMCDTCREFSDPVSIFEAGFSLPEDYGRRASLRLTAGRMVCNEVRAPLWWPSEAVIITGLQKRLLKRSSDRAETTDTARQEDGRR